MQSQVFQNSKSSENRTQLVKKVFFDKLTMASHEKKDGAPMKAERPYPRPWAGVHEEVFTWARFFNETGISAKLMNHPLTKLCEKLFDEHRLMDFHRCVLDVGYRKLLLNELSHN